MEIRDKVVLITGASSGIGLAAARLFAAEGARLSLVARSTEILERLAEELRRQGHEAIALTADMRDPSQVRKAIADTVEQLGRLDVLVNNAGQAARGTIADVDLEDYRQVMELNVFGPFVAMQAAIPVMRRQGGGLIINVSSMVAKMRIPGLAAYSSTKAAFSMLSETARTELAPANIRVITVYPRLTATKFAQNSLQPRLAPQQERRQPPMEADTAEFVAEKILASTVNEPVEQLMD